MVDDHEEDRQQTNEAKVVIRDDDRQWDMVNRSNGADSDGQQDGLIYKEIPDGSPEEPVYKIRVVEHGSGDDQHNQYPEGAFITSVGEHNNADVTTNFTSSNNYQQGNDLDHTNATNL